MRPSRSILPPLLLAAALAAGCGTSRPAPVIPHAPLRTATLGELMASFNQDASAIQTMTLKLQLTARAGKTKYSSFNAYLLTQKPSDIRIWGTFTLVGRIFDMASNGSHFELSLPTRNQFIEGQNDVIPAKVPNPLEKLRPQVILNALLINPVAPGQQVAFDPAEEPDTYDVLVLQPGSDGVDRLVRRITFSRYDLLPHRQLIYDADGIHATHASYGKFVVRDNLPIPTDMVIERPVEGYTLRLQVASSGIILNHPFPPPDPFQLQPPPGATVIKLSSNPSPDEIAGSR